MTEQGTPGLDLSELVQLIAREVDTAQRAVQPEETSGTMRVSRVCVRLGRADPALGEGRYDEQSDEVLLPARYPLERSGWELEVELLPGRLPQSRMPGSDWMPVAIAPQPTLADLLGTLPVEALKGAASAWAARLQGIGVETIADLASAKTSYLHAAVGAAHSRYLVELQFKARLLNVALPSIPASPADNKILLSLIDKTPEELRAIVGPTGFSALASEQLASLLALMVTTLDSRVLRSVAVKDLRDRFEQTPSTRVSRAPKGTAR